MGEKPRFLERAKESIEKDDWGGGEGVENRLAGVHLEHQKSVDC